MAHELRAASRGHDPLASVDFVLRVATGGLAGFWLLWWSLMRLAWMIATLVEGAELSEAVPIVVFAIATFGVSFGAWLGMVSRPAQNTRWCAVLALGGSAALASYWLWIRWCEDYRLNGHRWPVEPQDWGVVGVVLVMVGTLVWAVRVLGAARPSSCSARPEVTPSSVSEPAAGRARAAPRA